MAHPESGWLARENNRQRSAKPIGAGSLEAAHGRTRADIQDRGGSPVPAKPNGARWTHAQRKFREVHKADSPVADAMRDCSRRGAIVLDRFAGSRRTVMAAEQVGDALCGLKSPPYFDVAIRRWRAFTRRDTVLEAERTDLQ
jgi:hypothetical protein